MLILKSLMSNNGSAVPFTVQPLYEPVHEKTNNLGSDQVQHKPAVQSQKQVELRNFGYK